MMISAGIVLVVPLIVFSRRAIGMLRRPPANNVAEFLAHGTRKLPVVEVIGASTVHGNTGFDFVAETPATLALMAISVVGENLDSTFNRYADELNAVMRRVAGEQGLDFLPFNDALKAELRAECAEHGRDFVDSLIPMFRSLWLRYMLGVSFDRISRRRGYRLLVDGMHLNSRGGRIAADQIETWLDSVRP